MQSFSSSTPGIPPPRTQSRLNPSARRVRPSLHTSSFPPSHGTTQQYSSDSDLTLETTLHHLTDFLTQSLPSLGYSRDAITILRECIAIHLTPKLAPSWDVTNPSSGCGIRSLIAMPGKFPTPLVNAAKDAGIDVVKWAKGMSASGEWELWVDPGSICFRDGGWAWVDEGFESRGYKQTLHTIWQTPIVPQTPLGTSSNIPNSSPFTTSHFPAPPNSAPSAPAGSNRLINPQLYTNAVPIRAPAVFRIPPPPLPSSVVPGFESLSLNHNTPGGDRGATRKVALTAFRSDGAIEDDGWGEISQKLGERGALLMDAAMGEGRGLRKSSNASSGGGEREMNRLSAFGLLPSVDISFGQANKRLSFGSAPGSERSRDRSVSGNSSTGMRSIGNGECSDRDDNYGGGASSTDGDAINDANTRDEDGMVFLDTGLMAAIEGSDNEADEIAKRTPLPATPYVDIRTRTPSSDLEVIVSRHGTPILGVPGEFAVRRASPSTPHGAGIVNVIAETPHSETSDATTIKANRVLANNFDREERVGSNGMSLPSTLTNGAPRSRSTVPGATPSVQPYDGGNVGVLGGGVKLGGLGYSKAPVPPASVVAAPGGGSSAAHALAASAAAAGNGRSRGGQSGANAGTFDAGRLHGALGQGMYPGVLSPVLPPPTMPQMSNMASGYVGASAQGFASSLAPGQQSMDTASRSNQSIKEGKIGMVYPHAGKKRRGRPTARSTAHAQNGPTSITTAVGNGMSVVERPGTAGNAVAAAIASFEGPGRWTGLPSQGQGLEQGGQGSGAGNRRSRQNDNRQGGAGSNSSNVGNNPAGGMQQFQAQARWNVGGGVGMPVQGMNPNGGLVGGLGQHHQPILGTGISGQPGSGMVLANLHQHHQQNVMMNMNNVHIPVGWEGSHSMVPVPGTSSSPPSTNSGPTPILSSASGGLTMLSPGMSSATLNTATTGKAMASAAGKGSVPAAYGVPSGTSLSWQRSGTLPPPFVPSGSGL